MKFAVLTITTPLGLLSIPTVYVEFWIQSNAHLDDSSCLNQMIERLQKKVYVWLESTNIARLDRKNLVISKYHTEFAVRPNETDWEKKLKS